MQIIDEKIKPYVVNVSSNGYALEEDTGKNEKGEIKYRNHGYFSSLESCLWKIIKLKTESKNVTMNLKKYVKKLGKNTNEVMSVFEELKGTLKPTSKQ